MTTRLPTVTKLVNDTIGEAITGLEEAERALRDQADDSFGRGYAEEGNRLETAADNARSWVNRQKRLRVALADKLTEQEQA